MADRTEEKETNVIHNPLFPSMQVAVVKTNGHYSTKKYTSSIDPQSITIECEFTMKESGDLKGAKIDHSSMLLLKNGTIIIGDKSIEDDRTVSGHLGSSTTENIRDAVIAIQASDGVSHEEARAVDKIRDVAAMALKTHGQFTAQDVDDINSAANNAIKVANPPKKSR